jgi:RNA ligase (TIGR02306 family)
MTKLATIQKIHSILPHPNKEVERLEIGKVKEWPVVIPRGQYHDGDLVIFISIDSIVPESNPYFEFMRKQKFRIWNAKFKGVPSQGLVCPLTILPEYSINSLCGPMYSVKNVDGILGMRVEEGSDVTDVLGVIKYEKPIDLSVCGDAKGSFPTHLINMTDEDNLLNYPACRDEFMGEQCYLTVKADGSSMTVIHYNGEVSVCSRKLELKEGTGFWKHAELYDLPKKLKSMGKNLAIQAEACGGKIQGNPMGLAGWSMFVFNVKDLDTGRWYGYRDISDLCTELKVPMVRLAHDVFKFDTSWTIQKLQDLANAVTYVAHDGQIRKGEGVVLRTTTPKYSSILGKNLSVKILNQEY